MYKQLHVDHIYQKVVTLFVSYIYILIKHRCFKIVHFYLFIVSFFSQFLNRNTNRASSSPSHTVDLMQQRNFFSFGSNLGPYKKISWLHCCVMLWFTIYIYINTSVYKVVRYAARYLYCNLIYQKYYLVATKLWKTKRDEFMIHYTAVPC